MRVFFRFLENIWFFFDFVKFSVRRYFVIKGVGDGDWVFWDGIRA